MADAALARLRRMSNVFVPLPQPPNAFAELPSSASLHSAKPGRTRRPSLEAFQEELPALRESAPTETAHQISDEVTLVSVGYMLTRKASAEYLSDFVRSAMPSTVDNTVDTSAMRTVDTSATHKHRSRRMSLPEAALQISPLGFRDPTKVRRLLSSHESTAEGFLAVEQSPASRQSRSDGADRDAGGIVAVEGTPSSGTLYGVERPAGAVRPTSYDPLHPTTISRAVDTGSTGESPPAQGTRARFWWRAASAAWLSVAVDGGDGGGHHRQRGATQRERDPLSLSVGGDGTHHRHRRHKRRASDGNVLHHSCLPTSSEDTLSSGVGRQPSSVERGADGSAALSEKALRERGAAANSVPRGASTSAPGAGPSERGRALEPRSKHNWSSATRRASMSDALPLTGQEGVLLRGQEKSVARQQTARALGGVLPGEDTHTFRNGLNATNQDLSFTAFYHLMKDKFPEVSGRSASTKTTSLSKASADAKTVEIANSSPDGKPSSGVRASS
ncbi:hypothetical protein T484DRAFT_1883246 [Baffinella frigidus]|nr:hypothetical protein T484DRAFT_1883246 [Cryptophyta sp. CCMP2293]